MHDVQVRASTAVFARPLLALYSVLSLPLACLRRARASQVNTSGPRNGGRRKCSSRRESGRRRRGGGALRGRAQAPANCCGDAVAQLYL